MKSTHLSLLLTLTACNLPPEGPSGHNHPRDPNHH